PDPEGQMGEQQLGEHSVSADLLVVQHALGAHVDLIDRHCHHLVVLLAQAGPSSDIPLIVGSSAQELSETTANWPGAVPPGDPYMPCSRCGPAVRRAMSCLPLARA